MAWRDILGSRTDLPETEQIAQSRHDWEFTKLSGVPPRYVWSSVRGDRRASLSWTERSSGRWCLVGLTESGETVYSDSLDDFKERSFSRALWLAERFLDGSGSLERRPSLSGSPGESLYWKPEPPTGT
jgi:hypothetical protein